MRANKPLLHGGITASIVDSFFEVHKELGFGFRDYILVLHFGKKARFYRVFFENRFKQRNQRFP